MKEYKLQSFFISYKEQILNLLLVSAVIWMLIGSFPLVNYEGDSSLVIASCEYLSNIDFAFPPLVNYQWNMQAFTLLLVVFFKKILFFISCEQIYMLLTMIFTFLFLYFSSKLISFLTKRNIKVVALLMLCFFPESYSIISYPNSAIFAAFVFMFAINCYLFYKRQWITYILLGIAPLFRIDVLVVYPVILCIAYWKNRSFYKAIIDTFKMAFFTIVIYSILCFIFNINPFAVLGLEGSLRDVNTSTNILKSQLKLFSTYFLFTSYPLLLIGIFYLFKTKRFSLLLLALIPSILNYLVYFNHDSYCGKYYLYMLPFLSILLVVGFYWIKRYKFLFSFILLITLIELLIGISFNNDQKYPWFSTDYSIINNRPYCLNIGSFSLLEHIIKADFGAGQIVPTADELMLMTGHFYAPFYWHRIKKDIFNENKLVSNVLSNCQHDTVKIITTQSSSWRLQQLLMQNNFIFDRYEHVDFIYDYQYYFKNDKVYFIMCYNIARSDDCFNKIIEEKLNETFFMYINWDWQRYFMIEKTIGVNQLSNNFYLYSGTN